MYGPIDVQPSEGLADLSPNDGPMSHAARTPHFSQQLEQAMCQLPANRIGLIILWLSEAEDRARGPV